MDDSVIVLTLAGAVQAGTPIALAGLGELLTERAGILNLAVEAMMLVGAIATFLAIDASGSILVGFIVGALASMTVAFVHAVLSIDLRANQVLSGLALWIFATGVARFVGDPHGFRNVASTIGDTDFPLLSKLPVLGTIFFQQDVVVYFTWLLTALVAVYLTRTQPGLAARAVGESPAAADTIGLRVNRIRYFHTLAGGAFAGLAGGYVISRIVTSWNHESTIGGWGWIAIGLVTFASWQPYRLLLGAYMFGLAVRSNFLLQALGWTLVPAEVLAMMPYLLAITALVVLTKGDLRRKRGAPAALGLPYSREER